MSAIPANGAPLVCKGDIVGAEKASDSFRGGAAEHAVRRRVVGKQAY